MYHQILQLHQDYDTNNGNFQKVAIRNQMEI